jgi:hypothetical protein
MELVGGAVVPAITPPSLPDFANQKAKPPTVPNVSTVLITTGIRMAANPTFAAAGASDMFVEADGIDMI